MCQVQKRYIEYNEVQVHLRYLGTFEVYLVHRWYINVSSLYRFQAQKGMLSIVLYMYLFCIKLAIFQIFLAILYKIGIPFLYP